DGELGAVDGGDLDLEALGQGHAAGTEAHEGQVLGPAVPLENLVRDAGESAIECSVVEDLRFFAQARSAGHHLPLRASPGSLKGKNRTARHSTRCRALLSTARRARPGAP